MKKAYAVKIVINWSEASEVENLTFRTWASVNTQLSAWAAKRENRNGGYYKTEFTITFDNGDTYTGRIDLEYSDASKSRILETHILDFQRASAGLRRPAHMTAEYYQQYIRLYGEDPETHILFLDTHYLGDTPNVDMTHDYWPWCDDNEYPFDTVTYEPCKINRVAAAEILGHNAFVHGKPCVPALDNDLSPLLSGLGIGAALHVLKAWAFGWHNANLSADIQ